MARGAFSDTDPPIEPAASLPVRREPLPRGDFGDPFHLPGRADDLLQVGEVFDLDEHGADRLFIDALEVHALDVGAGRAHRAGDVGIEAAAVAALEREADEETLALRLLPVDLQAALRLVRQAPHARTV